MHLDNYIFQDDEVGDRFAEALISKAGEGVRVRVLYDWFGCLDVRRTFWRRMRKAGVEVRAVNPPTLGGPLGAIRRDHRKLLAVDGEYASAGGVCISEGWLVTPPDTGLPYRDTAVGVAEVERAFAGLWGEAGEALPDDECPDPESIPRAGEEAARVVVQEPRRMRTLRMLQLLTAGVEQRLWITDAYFLSMAILYQSLMSVARDGVDVRVLVPATNDLPWIGALSRTALQKSGYPLETHEQALAAAASGTLLGASLLALRFPRFLAWPLAAAGALYGGLGVLRAARSALSDRRLPAPQDIDDPSP